MKFYKEEEKQRLQIRMNQIVSELSILLGNKLQNCIELLQKISDSLDSVFHSENPVNSRWYLVLNSLENFIKNRKSKPHLLVVKDYITIIPEEQFEELFALLCCHIAFNPDSGVEKLSLEEIKITEPIVELLENLCERPTEIIKKIKLPVIEDENLDKRVNSIPISHSFDISVEKYEAPSLK